MSAASRLLSAQLRASDPGALRRLTRALRAAGGSVSGACEQLGMPVSTLYDLRRDVEAVRDVLQAHAMGRSGAQARATAATRRPKIEKST